MRLFSNKGRQPFFQSVFVLGSIFLLSSCISLSQQNEVAPATYIFETAVHQVDMGKKPAATAVVMVNVPTAVAGYDTSLMAYMQEPGKLEYFRDHRWIDTPARMLQPLVVKALAETGAYQAVVMAPTAVKADLLLEIELIRLRQVFSGTGSSQIQLALRLQIIAGNKVAATKLFEKSMSAASPDAQGGAAAVNKALGELLPEAAAFCAAQIQAP